jgi:hypothetical protein
MEKRPFTVVRYVFRPSVMAIDQIQHCWVFEGDKKDIDFGHVLSVIGKDIALLKETRELTRSLAADNEPQENLLFLDRELLHGVTAYQDICSIYNEWHAIKIIPQVISFGFTTITTNGTFSESQHAF